MMYKNTVLVTLLLLGILSSSFSFGQERFKAYNGVTFDYEVILPEGYANGKTYELAMVFTQRDKVDEGYESTLKTLNNAPKLKNTILFVPKVPLKNPHWISHPIHHALNDLMKDLRKSYGKSDQRFHFIGHLYGGRVAQTYAGMSSEYIASASFVNSSHWGTTKQQYFDQITKYDFKVYVYDKRKADALPLSVAKAKYQQVASLIAGIQMIDKREG